MKAPTILLVLLLAACGGNNGVTPVADVAEDVSALPDVVSDVPTLDVPAPDVAPDVAFDTGPQPPDPAAVFEQLVHPGSLPDTGWVDRVQQYRTTDVLADLDVGSITLMDGVVLAGTATGLFALPAGADVFAAVPLPGDPAPVKILGPATNGAVYVARGGAVSLVTTDLDVLPVLEPGGEIQAAFDCGDGFYLVADGQLSWSTGGALVPVEGAVATSATAACCSGGVVWTCSDAGVNFLDGEVWESRWSPDDPLTALAPYGADGVIVSTGNEVSNVSVEGYGDSLMVGLDELPTGGIHALAGWEESEIWALGHDIGATSVHPEGVHSDHFHSKRWLPAEQANGLAFDADGGLWVATPGGVSHLWKEKIALDDKAAVMQDHLDTWHWRLGFVSLYAHGVDPWDPVPGTQLLNDDDNDGQWTEEALAAFCYAYQVTGDEAYYEAGRKAVEGMFQLFDVPAADFAAAGLGFGYPARSVVRDDEGAIFDNKATQSNWHLVDHWDGHQYYWKDDTSSDEVTGHLYGLAIYHDLCAKDDGEREEVAHHLAGMIGYILDNDYKLLDLDGEPTTHGHWAPEDLALAVDGVEECCETYGLEICAGKCVESYYGGGFLNSVEILGGLLAAWHVSGEDRFLEAYEELITEHRYDEVATFGENVLTWTNSHMANYCDHELADLSFLTLLRYEPYPARRALWEQQVLASFEYESGERNPLKTLVIASTQEEVAGLAAGTRTLLEYPSDLRDWLVDNSHRLDVERDGEDRHGSPQFATALPYDEIHLMRWDSNPYRISKGGDGTTRLTPTFWLLPYWGLRYHGAISPELEGPST
ncbi:MAG: hypothetical protein ABIK09_03695 [Pseudomonadota bacterium]